MQDNKIKIAVSSCLLGEAVRYDGTDKHIEFITQQLALNYNLISLCPEMAIGMGVPRAPIHLVDDGSVIQAVGIDNPEKNMTKPLMQYGNEVVKSYPDVCGYIFKMNSPSCGIKNVKVLNAQGQYERKGQGIYVAAILSRLPLLPVINEEDCLNKEKMESFIERVEMYSKDNN